MNKIDPKKLKPAVYKDRSKFPNITDHYEQELKDEYGKMLVKMTKDVGEKLKQILIVKS